MFGVFWIEFRARPTRPRGRTLPHPLVQLGVGLDEQAVPAAGELEEEAVA